MHVKFCALFKEWSIYFSQFCWTPAVKPHWSSKAKCSWVAPLHLVPDPRLRGGERRCSCGALSSLLWENLCDIIILQVVGHPPSEYGIWFYCKSAPPTFLSVVWFFLLYVFSYRFQTFSTMAILQIVVLLVCLWEEVSLEFFYSVIFATLSFSKDFKFITGQRLMIRICCEIQCWLMNCWRLSADKSEHYKIWEDPSEGPLCKMQDLPQEAQSYSRWISEKNPFGHHRR